ncbi:hypothetical protein [Comamonas sp. AG1104]|uniref:hypothetical protein n=1 Tax=Comamonas sp. AG1104 TaxID=2183900 RepID=UPI0011C01DD6|nr:hypothetical protein [Comamonas sp. AG1104]
MDSNTTTHCQMRSGGLGWPLRKCHSRQGWQQHQKEAHRSGAGHGRNHEPAFSIASNAIQIYEKLGHLRNLIRRNDVSNNSFLFYCVPYFALICA